MAKEKTKYTITLTGQVNDVVDEISEMENISKPEVFRRSLALYNYLRKEVEAGGKVSIVDFSGKIKEIVFQ